ATRLSIFFFLQAEDGLRGFHVTGVQTCALPICMQGGRKIKAVIPGGSSVPVVPGEIMMQTNMDYDSVRAAGSAIGSAAVIVMDRSEERRAGQGRRYRGAPVTGIR